MKSTFYTSIPMPRIMGRLVKYKIVSSFCLICILSLSGISLSAQWVQQGPVSSEAGQVENIADSLVVGAINCVTPDPSDEDVLFVGAVNGGIWKTENATATTPSWTLISGNLSSQSIGALELDPLDASNQTLVVGNARTSSFANTGGGTRGIFRTTTGDAPWTDIDPNDFLAGVDITGIAARGSTIIVSCVTGIWRTTDTGANWTQISNGTGTGIPSGASFDLVADPSDNNTFYTNAGANGIYKSTDTGANWSKVSDAAIDTDLVSVGNVKIAVGNNDNVFIAIVRSGTLRDVYRSGNGGSNWTRLDLPTTTESGTVFGIHVGGQGNSNLSLAADPSDDNIVYIGGDRQPWSTEPAVPVTFPNSLGANDFSGRLFRIDAGQAAGSQATSITHSGTSNNSSPHADSRDMDFDANGDLIEGDDGGVYKQTSPNNASGDWFSLLGNMNISEVHSMDYDANANIIVTGLQDNGVTQQRFPVNNRWNTIRRGDGGDIAIDDISSTTQSIRYMSTQAFGAFRALTYSNGNSFVGTATPLLINTATSNSIFNDPINPQIFRFVTPIKLNSQNGQMFLVQTATNLFESTDQLATCTSIATVGSIRQDRGTDLIAYGASDNQNIIYLGSGVTLRVRTTAGGALNTTSYGGGRVIGVTIDPNDSQSAYVIDNNSVFETTDTGSNFEDITGDLLSLTPGNLRSISYIPNSTTDRLAVGTDTGVYFSEGPDFDTWVKLGTEMPNVPVYDLEYDIADQILVGATLGRGVWSYNLSERDPVDVHLVMDMSGSMLNDACPSGCDSKLNVLKDAAEIFVQLWKGLSVGDDRLGSTYFRTNVSDFTVGGDVLLPVLDQADNIIADIRSQTTNTASLTAMGGGLQKAFGDLDDDTRPRNIILFTDGIQNVDPGVTFPDLTIENGEYGPNSNINPTVPPTELDSDLGIKINTIGVGATSAFESQLADIADGTEGITKITTAPDEDLIQFYVEELVDVLRDFSPQLVAYVKSSYVNITQDTFMVNPSAKTVVFKISYKRGETPKVRILKNGREVTQDADLVNSDFYQIYTFTFEDLQKYLKDPRDQDWVVELRGGQSQRKYQIGVIADEEVLDYLFWTKGGSILAGEELVLGSNIKIKKEPTFKNMKVEATICHPNRSATNIVSQFKPKRRNFKTIKLEENETLGSQKLQILMQDPSFLKVMKPKKTTITLEPDNKESFFGFFDNTKISGTYTINFKLTGFHEATGPFERVETLSIVVKFGEFSFSNSKIKSKKKSNDIWNLDILPVDKFGNLLGPNYQNQFDIKIENGDLKGIKDGGNGSYRFEIKGPPGKVPVLNLGIFGKSWFTKSLDEL